MGGFKFGLFQKERTMGRIEVFGKAKTMKDLPGCIFANAFASPKICEICPAPSLCRETDESKDLFFNPNGNGANKPEKSG